MFREQKTFLADTTDQRKLADLHAEMLDRVRKRADQCPQVPPSRSVLGACDKYIGTIKGLRNLGVDDLNPLYCSIFSRGRHSPFRVRIQALNSFMPFRALVLGMKSPLKTAIPTRSCGMRMDMQYFWQKEPATSAGELGYQP